MTKIRDTAIEYLQRRKPDLDRHLIHALTEWMIENVPEPMIHKIAWRFDNMYIAITDKPSTLKECKGYHLYDYSKNRDMIMEEDSNTLIEEALARKGRQD